MYAIDPNVFISIPRHLDSFSLNVMHNVVTSSALALQNTKRASSNELGLYGSDFF